jgi:50S ribosomal protein L16 3-hydroxylase
MIKKKTPVPRSLASFSKTALQCLGGLTPERFMRDHWQKKPLVVRGAFPSWQMPAKGSRPINKDDVFALSADERLPSRFVNSSYELRHGPFRRRQLPSLKTPGWTVLVQQTNTVWPASEAFLDTFRFIPSCRLDDLMVSLASDQGGIGAHVDSYDVFLIQAYGCRRWEVAETFQPDIQDGLDLKILKRFKPEAIYDMHPGDLLYLPPGVAHRGTAQGTNCITYSVGFRAANRLEIADESFMAHLSGLSDSPWKDPWLKATDRPSRIPARLLKTMTDRVMACLPTRQQVEDQVVASLSEPASSVYFNPPHSNAKTLARFRADLQKGCEIQLRLGSRILIAGRRIAMNGEIMSLSTLPKALESKTAEYLEVLAERRRLDSKYCNAIALNPLILEIFYKMYLAEFIVI